MKKITKMESFVMYSQFREKYSVEFYIEFDDGSYQNFNDDLSAYETLSIPTNLFYKIAKKRHGSFKEKENSPLFRYVKDAKLFLEELTPYLVMLQLTI